MTSLMGRGYVSDYGFFNKSICHAHSHSSFHLSLCCQHLWYQYRLNPVTHSNVHQEYLQLYIKTNVIHFYFWPDCCCCCFCSVMRKGSFRFPLNQLRTSHHFLLFKQAQSRLSIYLSLVLQFSEETVECCLRSSHVQTPLK